MVIVKDSADNMVELTDGTVTVRCDGIGMMEIFDSIDEMVKEFEFIIELAKRNFEGFMFV